MPVYLRRHSCPHAPTIKLDVAGLPGTVEAQARVAVFAYGCTVMRLLLVAACRVKRRLCGSLYCLKLLWLQPLPSALFQHCVRKNCNSGSEQAILWVPYAVGVPVCQALMQTVALGRWVLGASSSGSEGCSRVCAREPIVTQRGVCVAVMVVVAR